ncbi:MAG: chromosomal replication initiator protein DnaA, partial [Proteobacteria bacterium]|nr:chromosomal replication initiator protein DnaA [Pseudomonadota bacterium]
MEKTWFALGAKLVAAGGKGEIAARDAWENVRVGLKDELGDAAFNSWLKSMSLVDCTGNQVTLGVPTRFVRDWVTSHYAAQILSLWQSVDSCIRAVDIRVDARAGRRTANDSVAVDLAESESEVSRGDVTGSGHSPERSLGRSHGRQSAQNLGRGSGPGLDHGLGHEDLSAPLDPRFRFESFVVGKTNELAYAAARRVAETPSVPFNPLFIYGGVGLGKTHLMHAIAWQICEAYPDRRVVYLSAEKFMYQFVRALRFKDVMAFKQQFRSVDVLMIDDVQFISGKDSTQEEFFHTFNALVDQNRQIVISGDRSPSDLDGMEERMRSRLGWGLVADIHTTDYELRLGILQSKLELNGNPDIPLRVLEFLAHRITSNVRELEGALNRVLAYSNLVGRAITLEMAQDVLRDLLRANDRRITIEDIQKRVAEHYNIRLADMHSPRRARSVARPRQVAMYLAKQLTTRSLPEIGRKFGGRDHTTVMHAVRKIDELRAADAGLSEDIDLLKR